jgi:hypothetical protein
MTDFFRFPHTPHLAWLGRHAPREDKVFDAPERSAFLSADLVVEEKVDGANLGFSLDPDGELRAQNRGSYLDLRQPSGQWKPLVRWLASRRHALQDALFADLIVFGEWCYAVHSVRYERLPDWFLVFDVYDRAEGEFWSVQRRNELAAALSLAVVPELGRGRFDQQGLEALLDRSMLTQGPPEGLYARREQGHRLLQRAKLVRAEFVQNIEEHWSKREIQANQLRTSP